MTEKASQVDSDNRRRRQNVAKQNEWRRENTTRINVSFTILSGIPQALEKACEATGQTVPQYARAAIIQALQWDGFNPEDYKPTNAK